MLLRVLLPGAVTSAGPAEEEVGLLTVLGAGLLGALLMLITIGQYLPPHMSAMSAMFDKIVANLHNPQNPETKSGKKQHC